MSTSDGRTRFIPYHQCPKKPDDALFQSIEWHDGAWKISELQGGFFTRFVPIKTIEDNKCPWCKIDLPNLEIADK
jgi:hypothetical protein